MVRKKEYAIERDGFHRCPTCDKPLSQIIDRHSGFTFCCGLSITYGLAPDPILDHKAVEAKLKEMNLSHINPPEDDMCCWILSDGRFYYETFMNHINTAYELHEKGILPESMDDERYIEKCWVKCTRSMFGGNVTIAMRGRPTARQLNSAVKLAEAHKKEFFEDAPYVAMYFKIDADSRIGATEWSKVYAMELDKETGKVKLENG